MISLIVCSRNNILFDQLRISITETIGLEFELIKIDNKLNSYNICQAYNHGAAEAKYKYLCFLHEDIIFTSKNWGPILVEHFENDANIGVIGVAGAKYKSIAPSGWHTANTNSDFINIIQVYNNEKALEVLNPEIGNQLVEVKVLDGVFLFTSKKIWEENPFDETAFKGFHGYDLDFCLQVGKKRKVLVCYQLLFEHYSSGVQNKDWIDSSILLANKWKRYLPLGNHLSKKEKRQLEWNQKRLFALKMRINNYNTTHILSVFFRFGFFRFFFPKGLISFVNEIINSFIKKLKNKSRSLPTT